MVTISARRARDAILHAAADAMRQAGAGGLRVDAVASAAGVNKRMLYHYFGAKDGLIRAVYARAAGRLVSSANALRDETRDILRVLLADVLDAAAAPAPGAVSAPQLQQAAAILLPVLVSRAAATAAETDTALAAVTPRQWQIFAIEIASLAFANVATAVFGTAPGSRAFQQVSERLLMRSKPHYRITSRSRPRAPR